MRAKVLGLALVALLAGAAARACILPDGIDRMRAETLRAVNAARGGLAALRADAALTTAAQRHACDMANRNRMSHRGSDGSAFAARVAAAGYRLAVANENVGMGYPGPAAMVAGWMASPGHRANILSADIRDTGIGIALAADGTPYWAMVSAARR